jgi:hypothetical protein
MLMLERDVRGQMTTIWSWVLLICLQRKAAVGFFFLRFASHGFMLFTFYYYLIGLFWLYCVLSWFA